MGELYDAQHSIVAHNVMWAVLCLIYTKLKTDTHT